MPSSVPSWWTEERIEATVNRQYVLDQLRPEEQQLLGRSLSFGDGLTDDTYLDWILTRARRFFLILVDIGIPDQIFGVVDESYDDEDLPIAANAVARLRLSYQPDPSLDKRFWKTQFQYVLKEIRGGDHVYYGEDDIMPVEVVSGRTPKGVGIKSDTSKDGTDKVQLYGAPSKTYTRRRIPLNEPPQYLTEAEVLAEVESMKKFNHEHLVSVFGSYSYRDSIHVLLMPAAEYTLKSFISDSPPQFKNLPKPVKRETIVNWPHCLADGLSWLHENGRHHGAIRPSNIQIDGTFRIFLGQFDSYKILRSQTKVNDIEAYQYAAPERWTRAPLAQSTAPARTTLHSGGRTSRKQPQPEVVDPIPESAASDRNSWASEAFSTVTTIPDTTSPTNTAAPSILSRDTFLPSSKKTEYAESIVSSNSSGTARVRSATDGSVKTFRHAPSTVSSSSSSSGRTARPATAIPNSVAAPAPEVRTAIVQTWQTGQHDPFPADIFALGAVTLDILSFLCKRSPSSFARHRSAKNRTAGRGGGLADASFHANPGQITSWMGILDHDAFKKDDKLFRSVPPYLAVIKDMLIKDPERRPDAAAVEHRYEDAIWRLGGLTDLHCQSAKARHRPPSFGPELGAKMPVFEEADSLLLEDDGDSLRTARAPGSPPAIPLRSPLRVLNPSHAPSSTPPNRNANRKTKSTENPNNPPSRDNAKSSSSSLSTSGLNFDFDDYDLYDDDEDEYGSANPSSDETGPSSTTNRGSLHMRPWSKELSLTESQDSFLVPGDIFPPDRDSSLNFKTDGRESRETVRRVDDNGPTFAAVSKSSQQSKDGSNEKEGDGATRASKPQNFSRKH